MRIRGLKPTLNQAKILQKNNMDHTQWLVKKVFPDRLECIHKLTGKTKYAFYQVLR